MVDSPGRTGHVDRRQGRARVQPIGGAVAVRIGQRGIGARRPLVGVRDAVVIVIKIRVIFGAVAIGVYGDGVGGVKGARVVGADQSVAIGIGIHGVPDAIAVLVGVEGGVGKRGTRVSRHGEERHAIDLRGFEIRGGARRPGRLAVAAGQELRLETSMGLPERMQGRQPSGHLKGAGGAGCRHRGG